MIGSSPHAKRGNGMRAFVILAFVVCAMTPACAADLVVYGAGSLREAIGQIATEFGQAHGISVTTQFGPSGRMRERIESGEHVDLFTSADVGHARKLVQDGRASVMAVFVRNTMCLLSPSRFGATTESVVDKLLAPGVRVGVSPPKIDPLADYTVQLFDLIDQIRPGSGAAMQSRAVVLDMSQGAPPPKSADPFAEAILAGRIDAAVVYCSGRARYAGLLQDATLVQFPADLQIGPEYGLAVLKDVHPSAFTLALTILSPAGQAALAQHGFKPVTLPSN